MHPPSAVRPRTTTDTAGTRHRQVSNLTEILEALKRAPGYITVTVPTKGEAR